MFPSWLSRQVAHSLHPLHKLEIYGQKLQNKIAGIGIAIGRRQDEMMGKV